MLLPLFSVIVTGAYLGVDLMSTKVYGEAPQCWYGFTSEGKKVNTGSSQANRKSILIPQGGIIEVEIEVINQPFLHQGQWYGRSTAKNI